MRPGRERREVIVRETENKRAAIEAVLLPRKVWAFADFNKHFEVGVLDRRQRD